MATTFTNLLYHIVYSTKNRRPLITPRLQDELYRYIGAIIRDERGTQLEIGGMPDHVHIAVRFRADASVAEMMRRIKANSSKWAGERWGPRQWLGWQTGYAAFTVSESQLATVRDYIRNQPEHHGNTTFEEEFVALLKRHGIEYDERYLWD